MDKPAGHAFISYVREDSHEVDRLQRALEAAGVSVWRDTAELWPGEDWRAKIRRAITDDALAFIACFSSRSVSRQKSYQNEELLLAIEQLRLRRPDDSWLIPVRFDDCDVPDRDIGGGRMLGSIQRVDLFGDNREMGLARLLAAVLRILGGSRLRQPLGRAADPRSSGRSDELDGARARLLSVARQVPKASPEPAVNVKPKRNISSDVSADVRARFSTAGDPLPALSGRDSQVLERDLPSGRYLVRWKKEGKGSLYVRDETERQFIVMGGIKFDSGEDVKRIKNSGPHILRVSGDDLEWAFSFTPI